MGTTSVQRLLVAVAAAAAIVGVAGCGGGGTKQAGSEKTTSATGTGQSATSGGEAGKEAGPPFKKVDICKVAATAITTLLDAGHTGNVTSKWVDEGQSEDTKTCLWTGRPGDQLSVELSRYDLFRPIDDVPADESPKALPGPWDAGWTSVSATTGQHMTWRRDQVSLDVDLDMSGDGKLTPDLARTIDAAVKAAGY